MTASRKRDRRPAYPGIRLLVVGDLFQARTLARHLPETWDVRRVSSVPVGADADLLVLYGATGPAVASARRAHPRAAVLAVVGRADPVDVMVGVLEAGADACVRDAPTAVVVGHLKACQRRRAAVHAGG